MPEYYADWWWEDLPAKAKEAALAMGYTPKTWDDDSYIAYDNKKISDCSAIQKSAAMYLGMNPIEAKCKIWWGETDDETKKHAQALGWDQHKWDDDWKIMDLPCEEKYWSELSAEEKEAAEFFGYSQPLWDETEEEDGLPDWDSAPKNEEDQQVHHVDEEEKKEEEVEDEYADETEEAEEEEAAVAEEKPKKKKKPFKLSKSFGGDGGGAFRLGNYKHIHKLTIYADSHVVNGIQVLHGGSIGTTDGKEHVFDLEKDEFIINASVRANKFVQSLQFRTNKGRTLGPCGGNGIRGKEKPGEIVPVPAPFKYQLCGFQGKCGARLDSIVLVWGPAPERKKK